MNITQVKIFPVDEEKLKAFVSIVFDHCFMVNDIKVIQGKDGLFLSMPSRRKKSGEFKDVAHPLNNETRRQIEETVLSEYRAMVDDPTPRRPDREDDDEADPAPRPHLGGVIGGSNGSTRPELRGARAERRQPGTSAPSEPPAGETAGGELGEALTAEEDPSLEEVQEKHLRDSFWTVT